MKTKFNIIKHYEKVIGTCPICKKRNTRSKIFWQSRNLLNLNTSNQIKTQEEIKLELLDEAKKYTWNFTCKKCKNKREII